VLLTSQVGARLELVVVRLDHASDEELLARAGEDEEAFSAFYRRYERPLVAFFVRAVRDGELAADLAAEVFATVVLSVERFDPALGTAAGWLFGIARNVLARSRERGRVEARARQLLGLPVLALDDETIERIEASAGDEQVLKLLDGLPEAQRSAVAARVLEERDYAAIAHELSCSEAVVRQRVSRGLSALRERLKEG
jgi:RNA polymerase sigma factor (sigma-70 family)